MKRVFISILLILVLFVLLPAVAHADAGEDLPDATIISAVPDYSESDIEAVAEVVYGEARGEPFAGQVAVANVLVNRLESGRYGKSIRQVVNAPNQFSSAGTTNDECLKAARYVMQCGIRPLPRNTFYFRTSTSRYWRTFRYFGRIGHHSFYTDGTPVIEQACRIEFSDPQEFLFFWITKSITSDLANEVE